MIGKKNLAVFLLTIVFVAGLFLISYAAAIVPNGAQVAAGTPERSDNNATSPGQDEAQAGNITELILTGTTITQAWQGYYGNVSGTVTLEDASGDVLYNWTGLADVSGEVYASTNQTVAWAGIQCLNFTANGTMESAGETAGGTNLAGTNLTRLHSEFNVGSTDGDAVNNTFTEGNSHAEFFTANLNFTIGECPSTDVFDNTGAVDGTFEEVLLYEPTTTSVVFAALLESDVTGFDNRAHDFEMLVLEDGHSGDESSTTYYFFAEIE